MVVRIFMIRRLTLITMVILFDHLTDISMIMNHDHQPLTTFIEVLLEGDIRLLGKVGWQQFLDQIPTQDKSLESGY